MENMASRVFESIGVLFMIAIAIIASLMRTDNHSLKSIVSGIFLALFIAFGVHQLLMGTTIEDNVQVVIVGVSTYISRDIASLIDAFAKHYLSDPKTAFENLKKLWGRKS